MEDDTHTRLPGGSGAESPRWIPGPSSVPILSAGAPWGTAAQGGDIQQETALFPVIVPDANLALLPGSGADCGLEDKFSKRLVACSKDAKHDHYDVGGTSCGRPWCPRHWKAWARRGADRVGRRIWGYKEASKGRRNPRHTVLSIADDDPIVIKRRGHSDKANIIYFRRYFTKRALSLGGKGGSIAIHLWRTNDDVPVTGDRRWDWVRKRENWRDFIKFSPHAHIIGFGFYDKWEKGDFTYKHFDPLVDRDAVESVAYYQLQHAPVGLGGNAIVYWGCCQPGYLKLVSKWTERRPVFCQKCNAPMIYQDNADEYSGKRSCAIYEICGPPVRRSGSTRSRSIWGPEGCPADRVHS